MVETEIPIHVPRSRFGKGYRYYGFTNEQANDPNIPPKRRIARGWHALAHNALDSLKNIDKYNRELPWDLQIPEIAGEYLKRAKRVIETGGDLHPDDKHEHPDL